MKRLFFCVSMLLLAGFSQAVQAIEPQVRVLRLGLFVPEGHVHVQQALIPWVRQVNALIEPEGYTIRLFSGGVLGRNAGLQARLLRTGVHDLTWIVNGYSAGRYPDVELMELPLLNDDPETMTRAFWRLYERGMISSLSDMRVLAVSTSPAYQLHLNFDIDDMSDLNGRKIRVNDATQARMVRAIGATPVGGIGANELAETLSRGLVEGALFSWHAMSSVGVERVTRTHIEQPFTFTPTMLAMNKDSFDSLPEPVRDVIVRTSGERLSLAYIHSMLSGAEAALRRAREDAGRTFHTPTDADRAIVNDALQRLGEAWHRHRPERLALIDALEEVLAELEAEGANRAGR
jgi:TRAP-type transport system periplasmic protein